MSAAIVEHLRREASKQDMLACEDMLKAADTIEALEARALAYEQALREIIGLYVGSNPEMRRARDIANTALPQDKESRP